ncbi:hypothetical protein [Fibrella aquatilis]|uniref:Uncharacterized protein n=1 Tax=Fibrella aquatilis TaxID=2817059 RepID=A0A939JW95_9BACT|nr:hypothetical protein [Fibrella aquatilis]MBO0929754.1 hypothetical protein [Fibrella aquatilis]
MGLFDFLKSKKKGQTSFTNGSYLDPGLSDAALFSLVRAAILIFQQHTDLDQDGIIGLIKARCTDEKIAVALYRFIPIAYTRLFLPEVVYSDKYILFKSKADETAFYFSKDKLYQTIAAECQRQFNQSISSETIMPILYHSAEFKAINSALLDGSDLKNLISSPAYFLVS